MRTNLVKLFRAAVAALMLGFLFTPAAVASGRTAEPTAPARTRRETLWGIPRNDPIIAVVALAGAVALVVAFAWIAARIGDKA
jgi:hypothetical protein